MYDIDLDFYVFDISNVLHHLEIVEIPYFCLNCFVFNLEIFHYVQPVIISTPFMVIWG